MTTPFTFILLTSGCAVLKPYTDKLKEAATMTLNPVDSQKMHPRDDGRCEVDGDRDGVL